EPALEAAYRAVRSAERALALLLDRRPFGVPGFAVDGCESQVHAPKVGFPLEGLAVEREGAAELALLGARPGEQRIPVRRLGRELLDLGESLARKRDQAQAETSPGLRVRRLDLGKLLEMRARLAVTAERKAGVAQP